MVRQNLAADGRIRPGMHFGHVPDLARPDHFRRTARSLVRVTLMPLCVATLYFAPLSARWRHSQMVWASGFCTETCFRAPRPGRSGGVHEVGMVTITASIIVALFIEHDAEIFWVCWRPLVDSGWTIGLGAR